MAGRRLWRWGVGLMLAAVLAAAMAVGIVRVNHAWPNARVLEIPAGESVVLEEVNWVVDGARWVDGPELPALLPGYRFEMRDPTGGPLPLAEQAMVVVDVTLRNEGLDVASCDVTNWYLESRAWRNGVDFRAWQILNPGQATRISLSADESLTVHLIYPLYSFQFKPGQWSAAPSREYQLVQLNYPDKWVLDLPAVRAG